MSDQQEQQNDVENEDLDVIDSEGDNPESALAAQVEQLQNDLQTAKEDVLRAQAEAQNARRRAEQDVEKAHKFGQEKLLLDLLQVVDNLERALAAADTENESMQGMIEGVELTLKSLVDTLTKYQVVVVDPEGEPFNPELHQAMSMIDNPDVEPNTVIQVFQKGYTLHGRLIRPAMVVVAKG